jgi:hypothetical protein
MIETDEDIPWPNQTIRQAYVGPSDWNDWARAETQKEQEVLTTPADSSQVFNAFGEPVTIDPSRKYSKYDWTKKLLTSDCKNCPLHVPAGEIGGLLSEAGALRSNMNRDSAGLCIFGQTGKYSSRRLLIQTFPEKPCSIPLDQREQRTRFKRAYGVLPKK